MPDAWWMRLRQLSRRARAWPLLQLPGWMVGFVVAVVLADCGAIVIAARRTTLHPSALLVFVLLIACGAVTIEMTRRSGETALFIKDVCGIWELPIAILLPPLFALIAPIPRIALTQWRVRKIEPHRRVFTAAAISLSYGSVYLVFHEFDRLTSLSLDTSGMQAARWIAAVAACAAVQWLVNHSLVLTAVKGSDPTASVRQMLLARESVHNDVTEASVAVLVTLGVAVSPVTLLFALPFVTLLQRSGRHSQLVSDSRTDSMTGLLNAATWRRESSAEAAQAARTGSDLAVALVDIDNFKEINDRHGHLVGDAVLSGIGQALRALVREDDLAGRFGGDEFALLLRGADREAALQIAERVRAQITCLRVVPPGSAETPAITVAASIGVATVKETGPQLTDLLATADAALYQAKRSGGNQIAPTGLTPSQPAAVSD
ncbi:MAG TPA: GGDEF domain-containing protein [Streptosporangiaceae bacterium]